MNKEEISKTKIPYNNRELSWMDFNLRVLQEAIKNENPIMERLNFLSITSSNLDEFFMVRVAGIMEQINSKYNKTDDSGFTPQELITKLSLKIHSFVDIQYNCWKNQILPTLKSKNIVFATVKELNNLQKNFVSDFFEKTLFPILTPLAIDKSRPFPNIINKSLNIAVKISKDKKSEFAIVQVPSIIPRFLDIPCENGRAFILIEEIIINNIEKLFELRNITSCTIFRITRNSDLHIDEDSEDLLIAVEKSIKKRKRGRPVRLEINSQCDKQTKKFLINSLNVSKKSIYDIDGPIDFTFLSKLYKQDFPETMKFAPIIPVDPVPNFSMCDDIFETIKQKDMMVYHPYESFSSVINFVTQAANDKDVLAIKQTLYRVSGNSPIIAALVKAAENGKQVTVLVELKARFDEENNINWAKKLEQAGCHVIYGLSGLKTHCKILLVVRKENNEIKRYIHMGTGNYNDSTAKIYTDIGMFTCKDSFGIDASALFNTITGYSGHSKYNKMIVAPVNMRKFFKDMIKTEISNAKQGLPSGIIIKVNSIVDYDIINLLYKASKAGVKITLIVRGICCLIPGIKGVSENIKVISIVGQLLEHSRIFMFENASDIKIFIGSADLMPRNLDKRVELIFPIEDEELKERIKEIINITLNDNVNAKIQLSNTEYVKEKSKQDLFINSHKELSKLARRLALEEIENTIAD